MTRVEARGQLPTMDRTLPRLWLDGCRAKQTLLLHSTPCLEHLRRVAASVLGCFPSAQSVAELNTADSFSKCQSADAGAPRFLVAEMDMARLIPLLAPNKKGPVFFPSLSSLGSNVRRRHNHVFPLAAAASFKADKCKLHRNQHAHALD